MSCAIGNSEVSSDSLMFERIGFDTLHGPRILVRHLVVASSPKARGPSRFWCTA